LEASHYHFFRVSAKDWKRRKKKALFNNIEQAKPSQWFKYTTLSVTMKIIPNQDPELLIESLSRTCYKERREPEQLEVFDASGTREATFNKLDFDQLA